MSATANNLDDVDVWLIERSGTCSPEWYNDERKTWDISPQLATRYTDWFHARYIIVEHELLRCTPTQHIFVSR